MALEWEEIESNPKDMDVIYPVRVSRSKVPGGWLVYTWERVSGVGGPAITFYPDPAHVWNGHSAP